MVRNLAKVVFKGATNIVSNLVSILNKYSTKCWRHESFPINMYSYRENDWCNIVFIHFIKFSIEYHVKWDDIHQGYHTSRYHQDTSRLFITYNETDLTI